MKIHQTIYTLLGYILFCILLLAGTPSPTWAQQEDKTEQVDKKNTPTANTSVREEIQRYLGYEELPARYLSLPYDATMNPAVRGPLVDISPLFLLFIPILFLLGYWKRPLAGSLFMLFCFIILAISVANSLVITNSPPFILDKPDLIANYLHNHSFSEAPITWINGQFHSFFRTIYSPLKQLFTTISGDYDHITYPLLILLFVGGFFALLNRIQRHDLKTRTIFVFTYIFSFLWLLLTAGIIWYGYLVVTLGILYVIYPFSKKIAEDKLQQGIRFGLLTVLAVVVVLLLNFKLMRYRPAVHVPSLDQTASIEERNQANTIRKNNKMQFYEPAILQYQLGDIDATQVLDNMYLGGGVTSVLEKINSEETSKVYRVGTIFPYFIKKSHTRVLLDNQLGIFQGIANEFKSQATITEVLKASGYKYILVDLSTHAIDNTPEKTLTRKFEIFMSFIYRNPSLQLLTTDRGIIVSGKTQMERRVFPNKEDEERVGHLGTFAIYEIK